MRFRFLIPAIATSAATLAGSESVDTVLARMNSAASSFRAMSAEVKRLNHTAIIDDTSQESGSVRMMRTGSGSPRFLIHFTAPDVKAVAFRDRKAEIYYPKIKTVHEYDLSKQRDLVDQFLLLGFGTSGKDLQRDYILRVVGEETVSGRKTTRLELKPKSAKTREHLEKVELWIAGDGGYPLQQKFYQPSGDYNLITYSDLKWNPDLSEDALRLDLPKGVKREYPQR